MKSVQHSEAVGKNFAMVYIFKNVFKIITYSHLSHFMIIPMTHSDTEYILAICIKNKIDLLYGNGHFVSVNVLSQSTI